MFGKRSEDLLEAKDEEEPPSKRQKIENTNLNPANDYVLLTNSFKTVQPKIEDRVSEEYQRLAWEALKKSIIGMINKVNTTNIADIVPELFKENIIRGRGILAKAIIQAHVANPTCTAMYAALVAVINAKFAQFGDLIIKRLVIQYKRGFGKNDKALCMTSACFLAHLLNQEVVQATLITEMVTQLLESPTSDDIEVAVKSLKECGKKLTQLAPNGMAALTQNLQGLLQEERNIDVPSRFEIENFFEVQKNDFKDFEPIPHGLDLVNEEDKYIHLLNLSDAIDGQDTLNVFKFDPDYLNTEDKHKAILKAILSDTSDDEGSADECDSEDDDEIVKEDDQQFVNENGADNSTLKKKIYLTVQANLDFEECAQKLLKLELTPEQIPEMCSIILDCCAQPRTYETMFGELAQHFCLLNKVYAESFTEIFGNTYKTVHRLETNKLKNVARFFAHLLYTDAISWKVLSVIKLNEEDTTSSSRIFIKNLFQALHEYMGLPILNERIKDITLQEALSGLFPRDNPHSTRFAINFLTCIGLGGLTHELRDHLKNVLQNPLPVMYDAAFAKETSSDDSSSLSSSSSSSSTVSSSSSSDSTSVASSPSESDSDTSDQSSDSHTDSSSSSLDSASDKINGEMDPFSEAILHYLEEGPK